MIIYTNAPATYDYWYVTALDPDAGRLTSSIDTRGPVRKLDIPSKNVEGQCMRYQSGLYPGLTQEEFREWVERGLIVLNKER